MVGQGGLPIAGRDAPGLSGLFWMTGAQVYESRFRIIRDEVQPGFHAEAASARRLGAGYPFRVVDPVALRPADELYKSLSVISEDRKYFSGASGSR